MSSERVAGQGWEGIGRYAEAMHRDYQEAVQEKGLRGTIAALCCTGNVLVEGDYPAANRMVGQRRVVLELTQVGQLLLDNPVFRWVNSNIDWVDRYSREEIFKSQAAREAFERLQRTVELNQRFQNQDHNLWKYDPRKDGMYQSLWRNE